MLSEFVTVESRKSIGNGLFAMFKIRKDNRIATFRGEKITNAEYNERKRHGFGGYANYLSVDCVLDCYSMAKAGISIASMANSPKGIYHAVTGQHAKENANLVIKDGEVYLVAIEDILPNCEIFVKYGPGYQGYV